MKVLSALILLIVFVQLISCGGSNPVEEGLKAFQNGDYGLAIKQFHLAQRKGLKSEISLEKLCLAYFYRGEELYNKTKNVKSFSGNVEKGLMYFPENPSQEFKKAYSKMLLSLGKAYYDTKPQNEIEVQELLDKTLTHLEQAVAQDSTNIEAGELLNKIRQDNYQKWLAKGKDYYNKAISKGNVDLYFAAEYYVKKAADFIPEDEEIDRLLSKIKAKTLSVLNFRDDVSLAIADYHSHEGKLFLDITIKNYLIDPVNININNFALVDKAGRSYTMDKKMMREIFSDRSLKNVELNREKSYIDGLLIFSITPNTKVDYLAYNVDNQKVTKKYFP